MIRYSLRCDQRHVFEMWFRDSATHDDLSAKAMIACPDCGSTRVEKAIMAPNVAAGRKTEAEAPKPAAQPDLTPRELARKLREYRTLVMAGTTDVGNRFPAEARAMHEGIAEHRPIRGQATLEEARALQEDGVPILPVPPEPPQEN